MAEKIFLITWRDKLTGQSGLYETENAEETEDYIAGLLEHNDLDVRLWKHHPYEVEVKVKI